MGSPLGPLFANIFLSFHEKSWLADCPSVFKPIFYRRYVDDCFLIFTSRDHVTPFLSYLNSKHPNIQFTHELESNLCLPFLDVKVIHSNGSFATTVLSLPRFIINLLPPDCLPILTVLFQCCTRKVYFSHLSLVTSTFALLMYFSTRKWKNSRKPSLLMVILQHLWIVVSNHFLIKCMILMIKLILARKRLYIFVFLSLVIMVCKFDHNFRNFSLLPIHTFLYVSSFVLLSNFFPFKDKIPGELRSHVVYLYKCQCCSALYVG